MDRALIFDMDGVLIDSEPLWRRAEVEVFAEVGLELDEADCLQTTGLRIDEAVDFWFARAPWSGRSREDVARAIVDRMVSVVTREGAPMAGVCEALDWAAGSPWRLALASSSPRLLIRAVLERLDLAEAFECVHSAEHEARGKPHPDVYLSTARSLALSPGACVAVEDSAHGVASAISAGMRCIAVPPPVAHADPRFAAATLRIGSLHELPEALDSLGEAPSPDV